MVKIHAAVGRHAAVPWLERHVAAVMDPHAGIIDGVAEKQRSHSDFDCGEGARALRMQAAKWYGIHRLALQGSESW
jgi:hypothetical protein